ncbi:aminotransferase [Actibacterium sp. MT2.3-13A]|uniref:aminotransferase n=1 Tax=Actibacterium sp. MT2.3-13A TaxID=2828332 RepID=UPI001BA777C7|nr:aminotransferase [Actibacterium sp. MT2.3-13A]
MSHPLPLNPLIAATARPPVMEAARWLRETPLPEGMPLINVSQAAPAVPPPRSLREALAEIVVNEPAAHLYGPDLGLPALRARLAADWSAAYGGAIGADQVAITAGCNQAFCAAMITLAGPGDEVILPTPWYFNHKMWCDMMGVRAVPLSTGEDLIPDPDRAAALITDRTRALVLVTPNNPGGVEYPAPVIRAFHDLAQARGIALIVDETYRDFHAQTGAPHDLFGDPDWAETLIHLYSFSKSYRLTGHRVGALVTSAGRLAEVEKFIDSTTICPNQIGQRAALWGMENLGQWLAGERAEILDRRAAITQGAQHLDGWRLRGVGAYFAWLEHPFDIPSDRLAQRLLAERAVLALPGTMFMPEGGGAAALRVAFANIDRAGISRLFDRLAGFAA